MKLKYTPLFIASIGVIVFGFYYMFYKWDSSIGPLGGILVMLLGVLCLGVNIIFRIIFRTLFFLQITSELLLIVIIAFSCYKLSLKVQLHVPPNYKGTIILVYGVNSAARLKPPHFFYRNIDVYVPPSGIVFIHNKFAEKYLNNLLVIDSLHHRAVEPGYGVGYGTDSLKCSNGEYKIEVLYYNYQIQSANPPIDTVARNLQKAVACKLLGN